MEHLQWLHKFELIKQLCPTMAKANFITTFIRNVDQTSIIVCQTFKVAKCAYLTLFIFSYIYEENKRNTYIPSLANMI